MSYLLLMAPDPCPTLSPSPQNPPHAAPLHPNSNVIPPIQHPRPSFQPPKPLPSTLTFSNNLVSKPPSREIFSPNPISAPLANPLDQNSNGPSPIVPSPKSFLIKSPSSLYPKSGSFVTKYSSPSQFLGSGKDYFPATNLKPPTWLPPKWGTCCSGTISFTYNYLESCSGTTPS